MRINAGKFRGFPILTTEIPGTKPTSDKVKQAIFNILGAAVQGSRVLDLFSGFGSLGLEALSRGAVRVVFVEKNRHCTRLLGQNLAKTGAQSQVEVLVLDVFAALEKLETRGESFSIVLSDAPYAEAGINAKILNTLAKSAILAKDSLLVIQHGKQDTLTGQEKSLHLVKSYGYGDTFLTVFKKES